MSEERGMDTNADVLCRMLTSALVVAESACDKHEFTVACSLRIKEAAVALSKGGVIAPQPKEKP